MAQNKTTLILVNLTEITLPIGSKYLQIVKKDKTTEVTVSLPFQVLLQKIESTNSEVLEAFKITNIKRFSDLERHWVDIIDFKKQKIDWRFKSRIRSNSNEFIDKLPVYLHGSKEKVQQHILDNSRLMAEEEEWEEVQGTLVCGVANKFRVTFSQEDEGDDDFDVQAIHFFVWPTFRMPTGSSTITLINTNHLFDQRSYSEESQELDFLVAQSLLAGRKFIQASEKLRQIQARLLNALKIDDVFRAMILEIVIGESMNQHSQISEKIFAFKRSVLIWGWILRNCNNGSRNEQDYQVLIQQLGSMQKDSVKQEEAFQQLLVLKQPLVQILLTLIGSHIEVVRNATLKTVEFLLDILNCSLEHQLIDILKAVRNCYPNQSSSTDGKIPDLDPIVIQSFFSIPFLKISQEASSNRAIIFFSLQLLHSEKDCIIKDVSTMSQSITQSAKNSYNHILENINIVISSSSHQLLQSVFYELIIPESFNAILPQEFRIYLLRYAEKLLQICEGDLAFPGTYLNSILDVLLETNTVKQSSPVRVQSASTAAVSPQGTNCIYQECQSLLHTIKAKYLTSLSDKAIVRTHEWVQKQLQLIIQQIESTGAFQLNSLTAQEIKKLDIILDICENLIESNEQTSKPTLQCVYTNDSSVLETSIGSCIGSKQERLHSKMSTTLKFLQFMLPLCNSMVFMMNYSIANQDRLPMFKKVWRIIVKLLQQTPKKVKQIQHLTIENLILPHLYKVNDFCQSSSPSKPMLEFLQLVLCEIRPLPEIEKLFMPTLLKAIPHNLHDEVFLVIGLLLDLTMGQLSTGNLRLIVNMLVHKYTMRSKEHKSLVNKLINEILLDSRFESLFDAFCDECLFRNFHGIGDDEAFFEKLGLVEQVIAQISVQHVQHFQRLISYQGKEAFERIFRWHRSQNICLKMVLSLSEFYMSHCAPNNFYEHPMVLQTAMPHNVVFGGSVSMVPFNHAFHPNQALGIGNPIYSEPSAELFSIGNHDDTFYQGSVDNPRVEVDPTTAAYLIPEIETNRRVHPHYQSLNVDQPYSFPIMAEERDDLNQESEMYESPRQAVVQVQTLSLCDSVSLINRDRLILIQIHASLIKISTEQPEHQQDANLKLCALNLMQNLFMCLLPTPTFRNMAVQALIRQDKVQINLVQAQVLRQQQPQQQLNLISQQAFSSNSSQHNMPQITIQSDPIPDFIDMQIPNYNPTSQQQPNDMGFASEFECWDQKYICARVVMFLKVSKFLEHILTQTSWSSLKSLALTVLASGCQVPDVSKLPNKLQRHLKNVISPLVIRLIQTNRKDSESKAGAISVLGSLSNFHSCQKPQDKLNNSKSDQSSYLSDTYQLNIKDHLDLFRKNSSFVSVAIWQEVFDLQDDQNRTIQSAATSLVQLSAPRDSVNHFLNIKREQYKLKVNELVGNMPLLKFVNSQFKSSRIDSNAASSVLHAPGSSTAEASIVTHPHESEQMFFLSQAHNPHEIDQSSSQQESESDDISEEGATPFQNYFYVDEMSDAELRKMLSLFKLRFNQVNSLLADRIISTRDNTGAHDQREEQQPLQQQSYKIPTSLMDFFEDNLLEDMINFTGKKNKHRANDNSDDVNSSSSDEIYIFKRQDSRNSNSAALELNEKKDKIGQIIGGKQAASLFVLHPHHESNEDLGIIDLDNQSGDDFEELDDDKLPVLKNTYAKKNRPNNSKSVAVGSRSQGGTIKARKITVVRTVESSNKLEDSPKITSLKHHYKASEARSLGSIDELMNQIEGGEYDSKSGLEANNDARSIGGISVHSLPVAIKRRQIQSAGGKREHSNSEKDLRVNHNNISDCDIEEVQIYVRQTRKRKTYIHQIAHNSVSSSEKDRVSSSQNSQPSSPSLTASQKSMPQQSQRQQPKVAVVQVVDHKRKTAMQQQPALTSNVALPSSQAFLAKRKPNLVTNTPLLHTAPPSQIKVMKKAPTQPNLKSKQITIKPKAQTSSEKETQVISLVQEKPAQKKNVRREEIKLDLDMLADVALDGISEEEGVQTEDDVKVSDIF